MASDSLPRTSPAAQQVASRAVLGFLDALESDPEISPHSLMILRRGAVIAEGWWAPYRADEVHLLYSLSKSFTSTACGLAVAEGRLDLASRLVDHFPEHDDVATHPWTRAITVRDLAAMATGHRLDTLDRAVAACPTDVVRGFLGLPPDEAPGELFCYNNGASYALGAVVQKVTNQTLSDYLRPRVLDPIGIGPAYWDRHGTGRELGFSGFHLTTEDIARFGELYRCGGAWGDRQLLSAEWVRAATMVQTDNPGEPNPDWQQGYGYQFWMARYGYRGDGAYGQFCVILPEHEVVIAMTNETLVMQQVLDAVWRHLLPAFGSATPEFDAALAERLTTLSIPMPDLNAAFPVDPERSADAWVGATGVRPDPAGGWLLDLLDHGHAFTVAVGDGIRRRTDVPVGPDRWLPIQASGGWADPDTFVAELIAVQTPHRLTVRLPNGGPATAQWTTVPLRTASLLGLATDQLPRTR